MAFCDLPSRITHYFCHNLLVTEKEKLTQIQGRGLRSHLSSKTLEEFMEKKIFSIPLATFGKYNISKVIKHCSV